MQAVAIRHLVGGAVLRGFSKWAACVAALAALRLAIATPLTSLAKHSLAAAYRSWTAMARGKAMQLTALTHLMHGAFLRGFDKWAVVVAGAHGAAAAVGVAVAQWAGGVRALSWRRWSSSAAAVRRHQRGLARLALLSEARGFGVWRAARRATRRLAALRGRASERLRADVTAGALRRWQLSAILARVCAEQEAASAVLAVRRAVWAAMGAWAVLAVRTAIRAKTRETQSFPLSGTGLAFEIWVEQLQVAVIGKETLGAVAAYRVLGLKARSLAQWAASYMAAERAKAAVDAAVRANGAAIVASWARWRAVAGWCASARNQLYSCATLWRLGAALGATRKWEAQARGARTAEALRLRVLAVLGASKAAAALRCWREAAAECRRPRAGARAMHAPLPSAYAAWREVARGRRLQLTALAHLAHGAFLRGFDKWAANVLAKRASRSTLGSPLAQWANASLARALRSCAAMAHGKAMQAAAIRHLVGGAMLRGFDKWAVGVDSLAALSRAIATPLTSWANASLARALRSWVAVARGEAMKAAAIRHLVGGALLRGSSHWAASVVTLAAARSLLDSTLSHWANASLARAYRSWAAKAAERALIRRCAQGFTHVETARRLHLWRNHRRAQHAVKRALVPTFGRWQMRTTAAAFDGWAASARGKAMQAQALRRLVGGALLRGFAKWASNLATLRSARALLSTPLGSWADRTVSAVW
ncbi:hypothetical protein T492DRAFT_918933, partial [Pavlovales sp. CCMP2436]